VDVEAAKVKETFEEVTSAFQREARLPGFRPGKVPKSVIEKNFAKALEDEVRKKLLNDSYKEALKQHDLHVVGQPEVEEVKFERDHDFQYVAKVETAPDFEMPEYKGLPAKRELRFVTDEDVVRALDVLREKAATYNDVDRAAKDGEIVVVNYTGTCEGKPLTDYSPTARGLTEQSNYWIEIKGGSFIPGFSEQLVGTTKGEKRTITVDFPQDFVAEQLSGKKGIYEVEIVQVKEKVLPPLSDEFAKSYNAENLEKLKEGVRTDLQRELDMKINRSIRTQVVDALGARVQCELPESMVHGETQNVVYDIVADNQRRGITKEQIDEKKNEIFNYATSSAKERLKIAFLFGRVAEKEKITVTKEELLTQVYHMAQQQGQKPEKMIKDLQKSGQMEQIYEKILFSKVVDFLQEHAKIEDVPAST
jgi:trigger factor